MARSKSSLFETEEKQEMKEDAMNIPEEPVQNEEEKKVVDFPATSDNAPSDADDIQDIDLSVIRKKRFRINGDKSKILELNTSDLSIATRLDVAYKELNQLMDEVGDVLKDIPDDEEISDEKSSAISSTLDKLDKEMRAKVDYIFDSNVSEICAPFGSMWDPINGAFRFEHIIDVITKLYETNINAEFGKMRARVNRRVSQYTKKHKH